MKLRCTVLYNLIYERRCRELGHEFLIYIVVMLANMVYIQQICTCSIYVWWVGMEFIHAIIQQGNSRVLEWYTFRILQIWLSKICFKLTVITYARYVTSTNLSLAHKVKQVGISQFNKKMQSVFFTVFHSCKSFAKNSFDRNPGNSQRTFLNSCVVFVVIGTFYWYVLSICWQKKL